MEALIKKTFITVIICIIILFMTGIFLPALISTNILPASLIIIIATTLIACGFISIAFIVKELWVFTNLKKIDEEKEYYDNHIC